MATPVPTLSSAGWVTSPSDKADALLSHFYTSDKFQTYLYGRNVTNLQWLIEQYGNDIVGLVQQIQNSLETYLGRFYDTASVEATSSLTDPTPPPNGRVDIRIACIVTENGKQYSFGREVQVTNSKIEKIINLNNNESVTLT